MAIIKCPKCGEKIENPSAGVVTCPKCGGKMRYTPKGAGNTQSATTKAETQKSPTKKCKHCKSDIPFDAKVCPHCRKKQKGGGCLKWVLIFVVVFGILGALVGNDGEDKAKKDEDTNSKAEETNGNVDEEPKEEEPKEEKSKEINPEEYKSQCVDLDYKEVSRNPDNYKGEKFKVTCQIFSVSKGSWGSGTYYKAFTDDGSGLYFSNMIWVFDKRDENSDGYVKLLEKDIVTFYGEFNGMQETKNALNGEKGEDIALDIYYAELIEQ